MLRKTALNRNGCMKMYARSFSSFPRSAIVCTCLVGIRRLSLGLMLIWFSRFASYRAHAPPIKNQYNSRRKAAFATYCTLCRRFYEFWEYRHARCSKDFGFSVSQQEGTDVEHLRGRFHAFACSRLLARTQMSALRSFVGVPNQNQLSLLFCCTCSTPYV